jgi:hypothetical protein
MGSPVLQEGVVEGGERPGFLLVGLEVPGDSFQLVVELVEEEVAYLRHSVSPEDYVSRLKSLRGG